MTRGHRFHAPQADRAALARRLPGRARASGHVLADFEARRERIRAGVDRRGRGRRRRRRHRPGRARRGDRADRMAGAARGRTSRPRFLELPPEVLIATMQDHQRYFPVRAEGRQAAAALHRGRATSKARIRRRCAPATSGWCGRGSRTPRFSTRPTARRRLDSRRAALGSRHFPGPARLARRQDRRGSPRSPARSPRVAGQDPATAQRAAELAKCDLADRHGRGVPGAAGRHGPLLRPERRRSRRRSPPRSPSSTCPRFAGDALPATGAGLALAVADKLDTLVGIFAIGQKPTGTKDPYGLRRSALGVLRILIETGIALDLRELIRTALDSVRADSPASAARRPPRHLARRDLRLHDGAPARLVPRGRGRRHDRDVRRRARHPARHRRSTSTIACARSPSFLSCPMPPASPPPTSASRTSSGRPASSRARASIRACSPIPTSASSRPKSRRFGRTSNVSSPRAAMRRRSTRLASLRGPRSMHSSTTCS